MYACLREDEFNGRGEGAVSVLSGGKGRWLLLHPCNKPRSSRNANFCDLLVMKNVGQHFRALDRLLHEGCSPPESPSILHEPCSFMSNMFLGSVLASDLRV